MGDRGEDTAILPCHSALASEAKVRGHLWVVGTRERESRVTGKTGERGFSWQSAADWASDLPIKSVLGSLGAGCLSPGQLGGAQFEGLEMCLSGTLERCVSSTRVCMIVPPRRFLALVCVCVCSHLRAWCATHTPPAWPGSSKHACCWVDELGPRAPIPLGLTGSRQAGEDGREVPGAPSLWLPLT